MLDTTEHPARLHTRPGLAPDAGPTAPDAGPTAPDAGPTAPDAGPTAPDAGPTAPDAGPTAPDRLRASLPGVLLILLAAWGAFRAARSAAAPAEDAAMLMRYAQHVAAGHGIVWNVGQRPVDGATDFLYLLTVSGVVRCGLGVEAGARLVSALAHLATVGLVYAAVRRGDGRGGGVWAASACAAYLCFGPANAYIAAGFGTPFFALWATLTWVAALAVCRAPFRQGASLAFACSGLLCALTRPEGTLLVGLMLAAIIYRLGWRQARRVLTTSVLVFALAGGSYFAWRWHYFGWPLPNPYYKKGGGHLYPDGLRQSVQNVLALCLPLLPVFFAALWLPQTARRAVFALTPVAGFTALWVLLSPEMNYQMRFQYAVLPLALIGAGTLIRGVLAAVRWPEPAAMGAGQRRLAVVTLAMAACLGIGYLRATFRPLPDAHHSLSEVGRDMAPYAAHGDTLLVSEAGLLPLYSGWTTVDAWGLNDAEIAHHGLSDDYLRARHPDVIMFIAPYTPVVPRWQSGEEFIPGFNKMVARLDAYARANGYVLAAAYGCSPYVAHYYWVRPDCPDRAALVSLIRGRAYWLNGSRCLDYAAVARAMHEDGAPGQTTATRGTL